MIAILATISLVIVVIAGLWIAAIGVGMMTMPDRMRRWLAMMASTQRINVTELSLRIVVGIALIGRANAAKFPDFFAYGGGFLIVSALILLVIPLRWHSGYAVWWSEKLGLSAIRLLGPVAIAMGCTLIWAAI